MGQKINKNQRYIILDTNIISSFSNENFGEKILEVLREVVGYGFGIAISDLTYFELLNEASPEKEHKMISALNGVTRFFIKRNILIAAGHLGSFYKEHNLSPDQFNSGDKIIASTAILHNCLIFTLNGRDFPQPFFKEIDRRMLNYHSKEYPVCAPSYFLEPQLQYIDEYHQKRMQPFIEKMNKIESRKKAVINEK